MLYPLNPPVCRNPPPPRHFGVLGLFEGSQSLCSGRRPPGHGIQGSELWESFKGVEDSGMGLKVRV